MSLKLLNYPGSKWGVAEEIAAMLPPHRTYLEPFFGSGAVFFTKAPSPIEIINDLDGDVANLFRVIRWSADMLADRVELTPYSREVYDDAWKDRGHDPVDEAARFLIRSKMGFGYKCHTRTGFKIDLVGREAGYAVREWNDVPQAIRDVAKKSLEVRKTVPAISNPFKVYVYETKAGGAGTGAVVCEFVCDYICFMQHPLDGSIGPKDCQAACLTEQEILDYAAGREVYGWHISELKVYDEPKELQDFNRPCPYRLPDGSRMDVPCPCDKYTWGFDEQTGLSYCTRRIGKAPQSWCYVEERLYE